MDCLMSTKILSQILAKKSKKGHLTLERQGDGFVTVEEGKGDPTKDLLDVVYENGKLLKYYTFDDVRKRAEIEKLRT